MPANVVTYIKDMTNQVFHKQTQGQLDGYIKC